MILKILKGKMLRSEKAMILEYYLVTKMKLQLMYLKERYGLYSI